MRDINLLAVDVRTPTGFDYNKKGLMSTNHSIESYFSRGVILFGRIHLL